MAQPALSDPGRRPLAAGSSEHRAFAAELARLSAAAAETVGGFEDRHFELAGLSLRLRFAGPAMAAPLTLGLAHLETDPVVDPDLTVRIWDSRSTSTPPPTPRWGGDDYREHGAIRGFFGDGFYTIYQRGTDVLNVLDSRRGEAYLWTDEADLLPEHVVAEPMRPLLNLWLGGQGVQLVHAAAVGRPDGCVLLVGKSGVGKSSTAIACLLSEASELSYLAEDYCMLTSGDPLTIFSLYCTGKVEAGALHRRPELRELVVPMPTRELAKVLLDLRPLLGRKPLREAPLRAIAVPRISSQPETRATPCSAGAALSAVAPSTLLQLPHPGEPVMRRLTEMVKSVPCFELELGSDPSLVPPALEALLEQA